MSESDQMEEVEEFDSSDQEMQTATMGMQIDSEDQQQDDQEVDVDQDEDSDDEVEQMLEEERNTWGTTKQAFYGRDKEADDVSSQDDGDELDEAMRLQSVRAKKLQRQKKHAVEESESDSSDADHQIDQEESVQGDSDSEGGFGDKMFGTKIGSAKDDDAKLLELKKEKLFEIKELIDDMKGVIATLDFEIEYPETEDFNNPNDLMSFTKLITVFVKKFACKGEKTLIKRNKKVIDFLKVKEQIVLNYCLYMNYYLLGQAKLLSDPTKSINLQENEVLKKLSYYRTLIKQIEPIDSEIKAQLQQVEYEEADQQAVEEEAEGEFDQEFEEELEGDAILSGDSEVEGELDNESDDLGIDVPAKDDNSEDIEDLSDDDEHWENGIQKASDKKVKPTDDYDSIANMLSFGNSNPQSSTVQNDTEVNEANKIIDKVIKNKKKVDKKHKSRANVDDLVSEEEEPVKKKKKLVAKKKKTEPVGKLENNGNFGGLEEFEQDSATTDQEANKNNHIKEKKREKKEQRKDVIKGRIEEQVENQNTSIQKNMHRTIMKGKGLYRKRNKKNRNPRIKHKEKYEKAVKKRNRMVQEHKKGPQKKYGGELTGIRSNLIKSTKL